MDIKPYAKAAIGALVAGLTSLVAALPDGLTAAEWLTAVIAALTVAGGVYVTPNATDDTPPND